MVIVVGFLAVLPLFVSRGNAGESRGTPTDAPGFTLTPGMPGQTPYDPSPTQCVDTCFTNIAVEVGCQDLSNTSCLCSNIKATQVLSKAALCLQQNCHGEFLNTAQYYEEICGQETHPTSQSSALLPGTGSTIVTFSSSTTDSGHTGTEPTRTDPSATVSPTTVTVINGESKAASTALPSAGSGNSEKAGDGVSTAAPASNAQDVSGTGDAVTQTVTDEVSSNTSAPGVNSHINAGTCVQRRIAAGLLLGGLCGFLGIASVW